MFAKPLIAVINRFTSAVLICLLVGVRPGSAAADLTSTLRFDIPAQDLPSALLDYSRQSGVQVTSRGELIEGKFTNGVVGTFVARGALDQLLTGAALTYRVIDSHTVAIREQTIAQGAAPDGPASAAAPAAADVEEVVVTAQKRLERLQDVPVPVSALSGATLVENNQLRLQDFYASVPALNLAMGNRGEPLLAVRGITTGPYNNPTVGIVVDDMPYGASTSLAGGAMAPDIDPSDLARVEALRGPQGTLYGASSLGGLLKFVTVDPSTSAFSGRAQAGITSVRNGDQAGYNVRGAVNVPLSSTVALRVSGFTRRDPGFIDDPLLGLEGVNSAEAEGGRLSALWRPTDQLTLKVSALLQSIRRDGSPEAHFTPGLGDLEHSDLRGTGEYDAHTRLYSASLNAKLGAADLTILSGYNDNSWASQDDMSPNFGFVSQLIFGVPGLREPERNETRKWTQEVRLSMPLGTRVDWLLGGFYTREKTDWLQRYLAIDPLTGLTAGDLGNYVFGPTHYQEAALFTDLTFQITDRFDVQVGGRQSHNRQRHDETTSGALFGGDSVAPTLRTNADAFTYLVTPRLRVSSDVMVYARLASGYRAGGPNFLSVVTGSPAQFDPDKTLNYELGLKASVPRAALTFDASVYTIDWKDLQLVVTDPITGFQYNTNASRARSRGVEVSVESRPRDRLTLNGWLAFNEAELTESFPSGAVYGVSGDRLPFSSRFSANVSIEQGFVLPGAWSAFLGGAVSYVGERSGQFMSSPQRQVFPAYAQTDLRAGIRRDDWALTLFVNNVTDRRGVLSGGLGTRNSVAFALIQPRTAGLSLARNF